MVCALFEPLEYDSSSAGDIDFKSQTAVFDVFGGVDILVADASLSAEGRLICGENRTIFAFTCRVGVDEEIRRGVIGAEVEQIN